MASVNSVSAGGVKEPVLGNRCFLEFSGKDGEACVIEHLQGEDQKPCKLRLKSINPKKLTPGQNEEVRKAFFLAVKSVVRTAPKKTLSKEEKDAFVQTIKRELYDGENPKKAPLMCGDLSSILDRVNVYIEDGELDDYVPTGYQKALQEQASGMVQFQPPAAGEDGAGEDDGTKAVKNFCADLILNGDPKELVSSGGLGGKRIVNVFEKHMDVFRSLLEDVEKLRRMDAKNPFGKIEDVDEDSPFNALGMFGPTMKKGVFDFVSAALDVIKKAGLAPEDLSTDSLKSEDGQKIRTALEGIARTQDVEWKIDTALKETFDGFEKTTSRGSLALELAKALGIGGSPETAQQKIILTLLHDRFEGMSKPELRKLFSGLVPGSDGSEILSGGQMLDILKFGGVALVKALQGLKVNIRDGIDQSDLDELTHKMPPMSESDLRVRLDGFLKTMQEKDPHLVGLTVLNPNKGTASIAQTVECRLEYNDDREPQTVILKLKKPDVENTFDKELSGLEKAFTSTEVLSWDKSDEYSLGFLATSLTDTLSEQTDVLGKLNARLDKIGMPNADPEANRESLTAAKEAAAMAIIESEIKLKLVWKLNSEIMGTPVKPSDPMPEYTSKDNLITWFAGKLDRSYADDVAALKARQKEEVDLLKEKHAEELKKLGTQDVEAVKSSQQQALEKLENSQKNAVTELENSQANAKEEIISNLKEEKFDGEVLFGLMETLNELDIRDSREFLAELAAFGKDEIGALQGKLAAFRDKEEGDLGKVKAKIDRDRMNNERAHLKGFVSSIREEMDFKNELGNALLGLVSYDEDLKAGKSVTTRTSQFKTKGGVSIDIEKEKECFSVLPALKDGSDKGIADFKNELQAAYNDYKAKHKKDFSVDGLKTELMKVAEKHCLLVSEDCMLMKAVPNPTLDSMIKETDAKIKEKENDKVALADLRKKVVRAKKSLLELARTFIDGIFNQNPPFFHCDLHGGNILYDADTGHFTIIDYGKGLVLSKDEQAAFKDLLNILASNPQKGSAGRLLDAYQKIVEGEIQRKLDGGAIQWKDVELDNLIRTKERLSELGTNSLRDNLTVAIEGKLKEPKDSNADLRHILDDKLTANGELLDAFRYQLEKANLAIPVAMFDFLDTIEKLVNSESKLDEMIAKLPAPAGSEPAGQIVDGQNPLNEEANVIKEVNVAFKSPLFKFKSPVRTEGFTYDIAEGAGVWGFEKGLTEGEPLNLFGSTEKDVVTVDLFTMKGAEKLGALRSMIDAEMKNKPPSKVLLQELMRRYEAAFNEFKKTVTPDAVGKEMNAKFLELIKDSFVRPTQFGNVPASGSRELEFLMLAAQLDTNAQDGSLSKQMADLISKARSKKDEAPTLTKDEITKGILEVLTKFETMVKNVGDAIRPQQEGSPEKLNDAQEKEKAQLERMCQLIAEKHKLTTTEKDLNKLLKVEEMRIQNIKTALNDEIDHGRVDSESIFPDITTDKDKEIRRICLDNESDPEDQTVVAWFNAVPNEIKILAKDVAKRDMGIEIAACDNALRTLNAKIQQNEQDLTADMSKAKRRKLERTNRLSKDRMRDIENRKNQLQEKIAKLDKLPLTREMCLACVEVKQRIDREEVRPLDNLGAVMNWAMPKDQTKTDLVDKFVDQQNEQSVKCAEFILQHKYAEEESGKSVDGTCRDKLTTSGSETKVEALVRRVKAYYTELAELDGKKPEDVGVMKNPEVQQKRAVIIKNQIDAVVAGLREKYEAIGSYPKEADLREKARKIWIAHSVHACLAENSTREKNSGIHTDYKHGGTGTINRPYALCKCCANDVLNFGAGDAPEDEIFGCYLYLPKKPAEGKQAA